MKRNLKIKHLTRQMLLSYRMILNSNKVYKMKMNLMKIPKMMKQNPLKIKTNKNNQIKMLKNNLKIQRKT